jgi:hypothetical protein
LIGCRGLTDQIDQSARAARGIGTRGADVGADADADEGDAHPKTLAYRV